MIGSNPFVSCFGGAPSHTAAHLPEHLRAVIRAGFSPVLCRPWTRQAACTLSPTMAKRLGDHPCGSAHVLDDPAKVGAIVNRFVDTHGGANVALHLGRSGLAIRQAPAAPGMTVELPGGIGHWWYALPFPDPNGDIWPWPLISGDRHVLVPPSRQREGAYRLVGGTIPASAAWLVTG